MTLREFGDLIGVRHGTVKRWATEGLPVLRDTWNGRTLKVTVLPHQALAWVKARYPHTIARHRESFLYLAERLNDGALKIGFSSDPARRCGREIRKELRNKFGIDTRVRLLGMTEGDKPAELRLHKRFSEHALGFEWFARAPEILALLEEWKRAA